MNCRKEVLQDQGKFFAEVFLCAGCHMQSTHFFNRLVGELNFLLTMAKESIRLSLVQGKFSFPEGPSGEPSKRAVLEEILKMEDAREKHNKERACLPTLSSEDTKPSAPSTDHQSAKEVASSTTESRRG